MLQNRGNNFITNCFRSSAFESMRNIHYKPSFSIFSTVSQPFRLILRKNRFRAKPPENPGDNKTAEKMARMRALKVGETPPNVIKLF